MTIDLNTTAQQYATRYPPKARWNRVGLFLLHTTETPSRSRHGSTLLGWPGYDGGAKAPNTTLLPDLQAKVLRARQHFPANSSARALRNGAAPGETNAVPCGVHQVELVGTCSRQVSRDWQRRGLVPDVDFVEWWRPPGWVLDDLAAYWVDLHRRWGVPLQLGSALWPAYPSSPEMDRAARMTRRQFERARGLVGHLHAPENEHLDPGAFPAGDLLRRALALAGQTPTTAPAQEDDMPTPDDLLNAPLHLGDGAKATLARLGGQKAQGDITVRDALIRSTVSSWSAEVTARQALAAVAALAAVVQAQASHGGADGAALVAAAKEGARQALDGVTLTVDATPGD